jgi:hypothetical protein
LQGQDIKKYFRYKMNRLGWSIIRTATFILIGLMNTVLIRPEDIGSWKNYAGHFFLLMAVVDVYFSVRNFVKRRNDVKK